MPEKKIKNLVVDTSAFIKGVPLQSLAENIYTIQDVIDEVTSKRQLRRLIVLPYDLKVRDVSAHEISFVTEFAKKTGDYTSLSATDIKVMALTYCMEIEKCGDEHLKKEPTVQKTVKITGLGKGVSVVEGDVPAENSEVKKIDGDKNVNESEISNLDAENDMCNEEASKLSEKIGNLKIELDAENIDQVLVRAESEEEGSEDDSESDSDGDDWITPANISEKKKELDLGDLEEKEVEVACITTDFAMQNVMKQIGLNITSVDGRIIKHIRTFIFRCTTCFKTTSIMTKVFCPKCGHNTLRKVAVSIDDQGNQQIHINARKPLSGRGKRFSLPTPKGGQHFQYPIITADQKVRDRKPTKLARQTNNPLDPDYVAGFSPFIMRDVNSRSAVLGVRSDKQNMKQWLTKQANHMRNKRK